MSEKERIEELRAEVDRLQRELDQSSSEKELSVRWKFMSDLGLILILFYYRKAQYGLALLEEKEQLEIRCDELETLFETTKHELDVTREHLTRFQESQQESTRTGIEHEESLLMESAMRERY